MDCLNTFQHNDPVFFLHIHKTAGTSFISLLDQQYTTDEVCPLDWPYRQKIYQVKQNELLNAKFIRGHFSYDELKNNIHKMPRVMTFLREPVTRFISHFMHLRRSPGDPEGIHEQIKNLSLAEFVHRPQLASTIANMSVRLIGGCLDSDKKGKCIPNLNLAKERLKTFEFFGITEEFDKSMELFSFLYCLPPMRYLREDNVAPRTSVHFKHSERTLSIIKKINSYDVQLYNFGRKLFEHRYMLMVAKREKKYAWCQEFTKTSTLWSNFKRVYPGQGWYISENHPRYGNIRWSGPETTSYLYLPIIDDRNLIIRFRVLRAVSPQVLDSLELFVNNCKVNLTRRSEGRQEAMIFEGQVSKSAVKRARGLSAFMFKVSQTIQPSEFNPQNQDVRKLGLCYDWLHVYPA